MNAADIVVTVFGVASVAVILRSLLGLYRLNREMRELEADINKTEAEFSGALRSGPTHTGPWLHMVPPEVSRHPDTGLPCSPPSPRPGDSRLDVLRLEGEPSAIIEALTAPTPTRRPDTPTRRDS